MAELIAAGTAIGVASSLVTFSDAAWRVLKRLKEYSNSIEDVPAVIKHIRAQLPILIEKMTELEQEYEDGSLIIPPHSALAMAVRNCGEQIKDLDALTMEMCLDKGGPKFKLLRKALSSISHEKKVSKAWAELESYKTTFILHFTGIRAAAKNNLQSTKPVFMVPFERDLGFIGRSGTITEIDQKLRTQSRVALTGIGGIGKSQIAIEYCYRFRERRPEAQVFWVHASTMTRFDQAYKEIARKLALPGCSDPEVDTRRLVAEWLSDEDHGTWLMVLDNADDIENFFGDNSHAPILEPERPLALFSCIPRSSKGSIVITTRDARVGERIADREKPIAIPPLTGGEAERLLRSKLAQDYEWGEMGPGELLHSLEYLPLAITQAAAFISENNITLAEYIEIFRASDSDFTSLLSEDYYDPRRDRDASSSVVRTWKLSFDQIRKQKPRAAQILSLMAVFDRQRVPKSLLYREDEKRTEFTTALGTLQAFSLITAEKGGETFSMHRLVQLSTQNWLKPQNTEVACQEEAVGLLSERFPAPPGNWKIFEVLSPHAQAVLEYQFTPTSSLLHRATLLHNVAWHEQQQGRYGIAYRHSMEAHNARQRLLGEYDHTTLVSLRLMSSVLRDQGKYGTSEKVGRRALDGIEKALGKGHLETLGSLSNLALTLRCQGRYEVAEEMTRQALDGYEKSLGRGHPDTLMSLNNLGSVLHHQGKYEAAEEMIRQALDVYEKSLGGDHPATLSSLTNLGSVLYYQGKFEAAEEMTRQALDGCERSLGSDHPATLTSLTILGSVLYYQGRFEAAEETTRRGLDGREKVLGKDHPNTFLSAGNLASVLLSQGKYEEAEETNRRALDGNERVLGEDHPATLTCLNKLASILWHQGRYDAAEELNRRALDRREKALGENHPDTLVSVYHLALLLHRQKKHDDASALYQRACIGFEQELGPTHPTTIKCYKGYSLMLADMMRGA